MRDRARAAGYAAGDLQAKAYEHVVRETGRVLLPGVGSESRPEARGRGCRARWEPDSSRSPLPGGRFRSLLEENIGWTVVGRHRAPSGLLTRSGSRLGRALSFPSHAAVGNAVGAVRRCGFADCGNPVNQPSFKIFLVYDSGGQSRYPDRIRGEQCAAPYRASSRLAAARRAGAADPHKSRRNQREPKSSRGGPGATISRRRASTATGRSVEGHADARHIGLKAVAPSHIV